jgi:CDP-glucose 4,6-dehydratase
MTCGIKAKHHGKFGMNKNFKKLKNFWKGKKVFITGHTGFKGSWLSIILSLLGAEVIGYSLATNNKISFFKLAKLDKLIKKSIVGDIRDYKKLRNSIEKARPDSIIHMAAQSLVRESYKNSKYTFDVNIGGTVNILEIIKELKMPRSLLVVTSDKVYKNNNSGKHYVEKDPLGGSDPYSNSKSCVELIAECYKNSFYSKNKISIATARSGNVIGGGDFSEDRIIPDYIRALKNKKNLLIRSPKSIRPWQHVIEPLIGYLKLLEMLMKKNKFFCNAWNFGPSRKNFYAVIDIVNIINQDFGNKVKVKIKTNLSKDFKESKILMLQSKKANSKLGWVPKYNIKKTLSLTTNWYKACLKKDNLLKFSQEQVKSYFLN